MTTATELLQRLAGRAVGVVGLGLIGGSLGLDLRKQGIAVHGWTHRQVTAERALARGLVDQASVHPEVLHGCALVLLALPLDQLVSPPPQLLEGLPSAIASHQLQEAVAKASPHTKYYCSLGIKAIT